MTTVNEHIENTHREALLIYGVCHGFKKLEVLHKSGNFVRWAWLKDAGIDIQDVLDKKYTLRIAVEEDINYLPLIG